MRNILLQYGVFGRIFTGTGVVYSMLIAYYFLITVDNLFGFTTFMLKNYSDFSISLMILISIIGFASTMLINNFFIGPLIGLYFIKLMIKKYGNKTLNEVWGKREALQSHNRITTFLEITLIAQRNGELKKR